MTIGTRIIRTPRGSALSCKGWPQEAALRMLMNNLDHDETLLIQSAKPVGVFRTHLGAPCVLIANALLVPAWATWETFRDLEDRGLTMYGQMTAGSWIYIGTQGQGPYETFAAAARRHFGGTLSGRVVLTAGLGGMGGAQPLAATMNGDAALVVEVDRDRIARSMALEANAADALNGYVPHGMSLAETAVLRERHPQQYIERSMASMARHVDAMLAFRARGAVTFDYGNNIRAPARRAGVENAFDIPGFVPEDVRPLFCEGKGPFRWAALSGDPDDIRVTDEAVLEMFPDDEPTGRARPMSASNAC